MTWVTVATAPFSQSQNVDHQLPRGAPAAAAAAARQLRGRVGTAHPRPPRQGVDGRGGLGRRERGEGRRDAVGVVAGVAQPRRVEHDRRPAGGRVEGRIAAAGQVGVGEVLGLARPRRRVQRPGRLIGVAAGPPDADGPGHGLDGAGDVLGLLLLLLRGGEQRGAGVRPGCLKVDAVGVVVGRTLGVGDRLGRGQPVVELAVAEDQDALEGVHEARPHAQRRGGHVRRVAPAGPDVAPGDGQGAVDAGRGGGVLAVAGPHVVRPAGDADGGRPVGPELDRLVGDRRLRVVDDGELRLVAGHSVRVVGGLRRVVEVLQQLGLDDQAAQTLDDVVHADAKHLGGQAGRERIEAGGVDHAAGDGRRQRRDRGRSGGHARDVTVGGVERHHAPDHTAGSGHDGGHAEEHCRNATPARVDHRRRHQGRTDGGIAGVRRRVRQRMELLIQTVEIPEVVAEPHAAGAAAEATQDIAGAVRQGIRAGVPPARGVRAHGEDGVARVDPRGRARRSVQQRRPDTRRGRRSWPPDGSPQGGCRVCARRRPYRPRR